MSLAPGTASSLCRALGPRGATPRPAGPRTPEGSTQPEGAAKRMLGGGHTKGLPVKGQETGVAGVASQQQRPREVPRGPEDTGVGRRLGPRPPSGCGSPATTLSSWIRWAAPRKGTWALPLCLSKPCWVGRAHLSCPQAPHRQALGTGVHPP